MVSFGGTILLCILATFTRLRDFRLTAKKLRAELHNEDKEKIKKFKDGAARMGRWTWRLFYCQLPLFATGVVALSIALWQLYCVHLFPK